MNENRYTSTRIIGGKPKKVIVDENGKIINRNPNNDELKDIGEERYKQIRIGAKYTEEDLLNELIRFEKKNGRPPTTKDFDNNPEYPSRKTYDNTFGSWIIALIKAGLNVDLIGLQGNRYRGRKAEINVLNHFKQHPVDLSGENQNSYCDGICPNGMTYDVKSAKLQKERKYYHFNTGNKDKDDDKEAIQWYYILALNDDGTIRYAWRIPGEMTESDHFYIGLNSSYEFNVENMKEYDITEQLKNR